MTEQHIREFESLEALKGDADAALKRQRGRDFEKLINDIFESEKLLLRPSFHTDDNKSEQIDGAIEVLGRIFLLEAKWQESNLVASDLYGFIGKVENKFLGTGGIFISRNELSDNFLNSLNKGRRQSVIVIHGADIEAIFEHQVLLKEYLEQTIRIISYDNKVHHPVKSFLESQKPLPNPEEEKDHNVEATRFIQDKIVKNGLSDEEIEKIKEKPTDTLDIVFSYVVNRFGGIYASTLKKMDFSIVRNAERFLQFYQPTPNILVSTAENYFSKLVLNNINLYYRDTFRDLFIGYYEQISMDARDTFEKGLIELFKKHLGDFNMENTLTIFLEPLWKSLKQTTRDQISWFYLDIYIDDLRQPRFAQKLFASELIEEGLIHQSVILEWLDDKFKNALTSYAGITSDAERLIASAYLPIAKHIGKQPADWSAFVHQRLTNLQIND